MSGRREIEATHLPSKRPLSISHVVARPSRTKAAHLVSSRAKSKTPSKKSAPRASVTTKSVTTNIGAFAGRAPAMTPKKSQMGRSSKQASSAIRPSALSQTGTKTPRMTARPRAPASKLANAPLSWQARNDRGLRERQTPIARRKKVSYSAGRRILPNRASPRAGAMEVDSDSSFEGTTIFSSVFEKAAKKNPVPEPASDDDTDDSDALYAGPPSAIDISSDSEREVDVFTSSDEEDEPAPDEPALTHPPSDELLIALKGLTLDAQHKAQTSTLPFLPRNVRRGFLLACKSRQVSVSRDVPDETRGIVYKYCIAGAAAYTARRQANGYECPLCDLHGLLRSKAVFQKHLQWDHPEAKVDIEERRGACTITSSIPERIGPIKHNERRTDLSATAAMPSSAAAVQQLAAVVQPPQATEASETALDISINASASVALTLPSPGRPQPISNRLVTHEVMKAEPVVESPARPHSRSPSPLPRPPIVIRAPTPLRASASSQLPLPAHPRIPSSSPSLSPPPALPRRRVHLPLASASPNVSPPPEVSTLAAAAPSRVASPIRQASPPPAISPAALAPRIRPPLTPPPIHRRLGPSLSPISPDFFPATSDYPGGHTVYYSTRPEGPRLYDMLGTLPLEPYGILTWFVLDAEEEILNAADVPDEQKVMQALWSRWIFLHRLDFVKNYEAGARMFLDEHWRLIHKTAGWAALNNLLLVLYMNRFLKMNQVAILLRHYQDLVKWDHWYK